MSDDILPAMDTDIQPAYDSLTQLWHLAQDLPEEKMVEAVELLGVVDTTLTAKKGEVDAHRETVAVVEMFYQAVVEELREKLRQALGEVEHLTRNAQREALHTAARDLAMEHNLAFEVAQRVLDVLLGGRVAGVSGYTDMDLHDAIWRVAEEIEEELFAHDPTRYEEVD